MRLHRPTAITAAFLIIAFSDPPSLFAQTAPKPSQRKQPESRQRQTKRPQRADALAAAINELLKLDPLSPESLSDNSSDTPQEEEKPPADDAPIKDLIEYWSVAGFAAMSDGAEGPQPSEKVRRRLLEAVEDRPWFAGSLLAFLPESPDTHDRLYRLINQEPDDEDGWKAQVREWLTLNSNHFRDNLLARVRSTGQGEAQTAKALTSLSRLDWDVARPFVESYAPGNGEILAATALSLLYEREMKVGDAAKAEGYRARLKAMVANRQAPADTRGAALATLMAAEWSGREEWFAALFADPSLSGLRVAEVIKPDGEEEAADVKAKTESQTRMGHHPVYVGLPANLLSTAPLKPGELIPLVSSLVGHDSRTVHNAAVKWLADVIKSEGYQKPTQEAARTLLPWLTDPGWADEGSRASFIRGFAYLELPESVAGLMWVLDFDESADNRAAAAEALAQYRDPRANPALRRALEREGSEDRRKEIVTALAECGGFSDDEMADAIEAYAKVGSAEEGGRDLHYYRTVGPEKPLPLKVSVGRILSENRKVQFTEGLAVKLIERAKALRATQPRASRKILSEVEGVSLRAAEINLVERIGEGWADVNSIGSALKTRDSLRKSAGDELFELIEQGGYAAGVAAAVLNDEREWKAALESGDAKAQLALLACARHIGDKLPVELAGKLLGSPNRALAKAAESYLEAEDSAEARKLILARRPGEAHILGDISPTDDPGFITGVGLKHWEEKMRREVKSINGAEEIYALGGPHRDGPDAFLGAVIRVRGGKAEISIYEDQARRSYRQLTPVELEELKSIAARQEVEDLGPEPREPGFSIAENPNYLYLRLNKDGGRRILLRSLRRTPKNPTPYEEVAGLFLRLGNSGEFKTRYDLEDKIPGLEVMLADKKQPVISVCQEKGELRVLTCDAVGYLFKTACPLVPLEWRAFTLDGVGGVAEETPACRRSVALFGTGRDESERIYAITGGKDRGVWRADPGQDPVKLLDDAYEYVFAMPDGKWLIGPKVVNEDEGRGARLVRHNLRTNEVFPIVLPREGYRSIRFSEAHGKALIIDGSDASPLANGYLLDVETGSTQEIKGDFRPFVDEEIRNLQPTGRPNEFWVAIFDDQKQATNVGRYDAKTFTFTPLTQIPELRIESADIWIDQTAGWLWLAYRGHLLRAPFPQNQKTK